jgi:rhodanese-related sulfurtransferase/mannose-6-phosphate isomerase-like protein (cupin superfamily)
MQLATTERLVRDASTLIGAKKQSDEITRTPEELANIVSLFASSDGWMDRVRLRADERWYERLYHGPDHDIWVISWLPGQSTGFHDHGESSGAFVVVTGLLEEYRPDEQPLAIHPGKPRAFGLDYAHDVRNVSLSPAVSIHAYSPPLTDMILIDIRPESQRKIEGSIPGALIVERNVLKWRFDPASSSRLPVATDHDLQVIVFCSEGYTSSLAAAALHDLGLWRATDMVGGFHAWRATGQPFVPPSEAHNAQPR